MKLKEIFKGIDIIEVSKEVDFEDDILKIAYHSKEVVPESIFVAIKGYETDGHKYIKNAISNGAKYAVVEYFVDEDIAQIRVNNSRETLADMANNFYEEPSKKLNITAITATNGKTTTSFMVDKIYKDAGFKTGIIGTVYTKYADVLIPSILTTPESLNLQEFFDDMNKNKIEKVTMEVSSSALELSRAKNADFDIVTFNNFSREHIDQHGSFERYYEVKSKLIKGANEDAIAILNFDFKEIEALKDKTRARVLSYSLEKQNEDFSISNLDLSTGKGKFTFNINREINLKSHTIKKGSFNIELNVAGYSSVMNSVAAIIVALCQNIDIEVIKSSLKTFTGVERRFEMIFDEDFKIIDDHYANTRNIDVTMETLSKMKYKDLRMLYAIRGNRGVNLNRETAQETVKWLRELKPKTFIATLSEDVVSHKDEVSKEELDVFCEVMRENDIDVKIYKTLRESIDKILDSVCEDDAVLLAGCQGMDKGAKFVYENLVSNGKIKNKEELKQRVDNRIC